MDKTVKMHNMYCILVCIMKKLLPKPCDTSVSDLKILQLDGLLVNNTTFDYFGSNSFEEAKLLVSRLSINWKLLVGGLQLPKFTLDSWFLQSVGGNYDNSCTALVHKDKSVAMAVIQTSLP